jgi:hypothetical protein
MKNYFIIMLFACVGSSLLFPQKLFSQKTKQKIEDSAGVQPPVTAETSSGSAETARVNFENLSPFGVGPTNYRNFFVKLSSNLEGKRENNKGDGVEVHTDAEGRLVKKKKPDLKISSDVTGKIIEWRTARTSSWDDDTLVVAFSEPNDKAPYVVLMFRFCEWNGDQTTSICVNPKNKAPDGSLFYLQAGDGWFSFSSSTAEVCLLFEYIEEEPDDPYEPKGRKPGESTGAKVPHEEKWGNKGMVVSDL